MTAFWAYDRLQAPPVCPIDLFKVRSKVSRLAIVCQVILPVSRVQVFQHGYELDVGFFDLVSSLVRMFLESGVVTGLEKVLVFILGKAPLAEAKSGRLCPLVLQSKLVGSDDTHVDDGDVFGVVWIQTEFDETFGQATDPWMEIVFGVVSHIPIVFIQILGMGVVVVVIDHENHRLGTDEGAEPRVLVEVVDGVDPVSWLAQVNDKSVDLIRVESIGGSNVPRARHEWRLSHPEDQCLREESTG